MSVLPALVSLSHFQAADRAVLVIRHAEREPIPDPLKPELAELTPAGMQAARELGARLGDFRVLRFFHSPVKRCRQTAECIAEGARTLGLVVGEPRPVVSLGLGYIRGMHEVAELTRIHGDGFTRLWLGGGIDPRHMQEPAALSTHMRGHMEEQLSHASRGGRRLDVHVTHDWNLLVLRELHLGLRHEEIGWVEFLDGIAYAPGDNGALQGAVGTRRGQVRC
jgi:hypothetical protein